MYGTQAADAAYLAGTEFENDVKMYGTQAIVTGRTWNGSLRMM